MEVVSPQPIFGIIGALQTAKYLFVADETKLFEYLNTQPQSLEAISNQISYPVRTARILLDALAATGFLHKENGLYSSSPLAFTYLGGSTRTDLRPMLRLWKHLVHQQWSKLAQSLQEDQATLAFRDLSDREQEIFSHGVASLTAPTAGRLAEVYDFKQHHRVLDLAGGMGAFLSAAIRSNPSIDAALFELPITAALARQHWAATPKSISIIEGDLFADELPNGYDAVILANIVHMFLPERNKDLFHRLRKAVKPGTQFLLIDFWTDLTRTQPVFAALMAGEFQMFTGEGDVYSRQEVEDWLSETGWQPIDFQQLTATASLIVAQAY